MPAARQFVLLALTMISTAAGYAAGRDIPVTDHGIEPLPPAAFVRPLPFFYDIYTFRGRDGSTDIVTAFAVEAGRLETEEADGRTRYRFSVSLVLADTMLGSVSDTHDTVFVAVARELESDHLLYTHVDVVAPPSKTTKQRVIMTDATTPGIGQLYSSLFVIPDYSGSALMVSDIALGHPDADSGWHRGDATLALLPTGQFPASAFDVFYEIYNLPEGHEYTTELAVERLDLRAGHAREPVRLRFAGKSAALPDAVLPELRRVESPLPRGTYRLTVTITDLTSGEAASRSRTFEVRDDEWSATMVAAHRSAQSGGAP